MNERDRITFDPASDPPEDLREGIAEGFMDAARTPMPNPEWITCPVCEDGGPRDQVEAAIAHIERRAVTAALDALAVEVAGLTDTPGWRTTFVSLAAVLDVIKKAKAYREDTDHATD